MMSTTAICDTLDEWLAPFTFTDYCYDGVQIHGSPTVGAVCFALDPCLEVLEQVPENSLLVCHHALIWGKIDRIDAMLRRRLELLIRKNITLYVSHLPLDSHQSLGTAATLTRMLGLTDVAAFGFENTKPLGRRGLLPTAMSLDDFTAKLGEVLETGEVRAVSGGDHTIRKVAIVTGGAGETFLQKAIRRQADVFVTGDSKFSMVYPARECGIHVVFAGHYPTEIIAMRTLMDAVGEEYPDLECRLIDAPTPL